MQSMSVMNELTAYYFDVICLITLNLMTNYPVNWTRLVC